MVSLTIEGKEVSAKPNQMILEAAREQGFAIPTLCYHEALKPFGACRLCIVEVKTNKGWNLVTSCTYPCTEGLIVRTNSEGILHSRRMTVELLMASSAHVPIVQELAEDLGVGTPRFTMAQSDCILCGLCVRVCEEIVGVGALSIEALTRESAHHSKLLPTLVSNVGLVSWSAPPVRLLLQILPVMQERYMI